MIRRLLRLVAINLLVLVVGLGALELIFGGWLAIDPLDRLNIARDSSAQVDPSGLYPGAAPFTYRRDHWGFRGAGTDPAAITVLTVGGSTTNQLYLPDELTWQAVAARALADRGKPVRFANAGIDGQSTVGHLFNFESWFPHVPGLKPRLVLVYVGVNDAMIGPNVTDSLGFSSVHKWFRHNSALFRLGRSITGALEARRMKLTHEPVDFEHATWTDQPSVADNRTARREADPVAYAGRLRVLAERIRAMGAQPVFVTQTRGDYRRLEDGTLVGLVDPTGGLNGLDHHRLLSEFNAVTLAVCAETGVICLDLAGEVNFVPGDFYDHVHNTPAGAERSGRWLADRLAPLL